MKQALLVIFLWTPVLCMGQQQTNVSGGNQQPAAKIQDQENVVSPTPSDSANDKSKTSDQATPSDSPSNITIAHFTEVLAVVAIIQAMIYGIQCYMMKLSIDQSRKSSEAQLRAYISILTHDGLDKIGHADLLNERVSVRIENTGQTPAYNVITWLFWKSFHGADQHLPNNFDFPGLESVDDKLLKRTGSSFTVGSGHKATTQHGFLTNPEGLGFSDAYQKFLKDEATIFLFFKVEYYDIFKKNTPHHTTVCCRLSVLPNETNSLHRLVRVSVYDTFNDCT